MIPWTVAHQSPLSVEFFRQESWSGLPFPSPEDLPDPGIEPGSPALLVDSLLSEPPGVDFPKSRPLTGEAEQERDRDGQGHIQALNIHVSNSYCVLGIA